MEYGKLVEFLGLMFDLLLVMMVIVVVVIVFLIVVIGICSLVFCLIGM